MQLMLTLHEITENVLLFSNKILETFIYHLNYYNDKDYPMTKSV